MRLMCMWWFPVALLGGKRVCLGVLRFSCTQQFYAHFNPLQMSPPCPSPLFHSNNVIIFRTRGRKREKCPEIVGYSVLSPLAPSDLSTSEHPFHSTVDSTPQPSHALNRSHARPPRMSISARS
ncbi:uncharacterized protein EI97DRAFT_129731 [Westerdykella ornata]|uniref:Secreted protein n=1 Tax=Westerdykella ornata TaxID=318751 RepID=A0A6A6JD25_WESOR|nr:uncharacterized protein EI97DRAFT_129731 [Westerdykella ornata]KAF2274167.1 hypothetical protein EI97DRAFT_129731 [Westerdykella ornata]